MKKYATEKTTFITDEDGKSIPVSTLPEELQKEFEVLDQMKIDYTDALYKVEVLRFAIKGKSDVIISEVAKILEAKKPKKEKKAPAAKDSE